MGRDAFVKTLTRRLDSVRSVQEVPTVQRFAQRPVLTILFGQREAGPREKRHRLIRVAHWKHGGMLTEIVLADIPVSQMVNAPSAEERFKT